MANTYSLSTRVRLNNGLSMPHIHLGLSQTSSGEETSNAVRWALEAGYRAFDSAQTYHNEAEAGHAILDFLQSPANTESLTREDIWFTSKLASNNNTTSSYDAARRSIKHSVQACGLGYIDLFLLQHSPDDGGKSKRLECWRAIEDAIADGEVRTGGVSNFGIKHIQDLLSTTTPPLRHIPAITHLPLNPFHPAPPTLLSFCTTHSIHIATTAPLGQHAHVDTHTHTHTDTDQQHQQHPQHPQHPQQLQRLQRLQHPTIASLSRKYSCSPAQLLIRWSLQRGWVVVVEVEVEKDTEEEEIREGIRLNGEVEDVVIDEGDLGVLDGLDEGVSLEGEDGEGE